MRKLSVFLGVVMILALSTAPAFAQENGADTSPHPPTVGKLVAMGEGTASLDVNQGRVRIYVVGDVIIDGPWGLDIVVNSFVASALAPQSDGTHLELTGLSGEVIVTGADYTIDIDGVMAFRGFGHGSAQLDGTGLWETRRGQGVWPKGFLEYREAQ